MIVGSARNQQVVARCLLTVKRFIMPGYDKDEKRRRRWAAFPCLYVVWLISALTSFQCGHCHLLAGRRVRKMANLVVVLIRTPENGGGGSPDWSDEKFGRGDQGPGKKVRIRTDLC